MNRLILFTLAGLFSVSASALPMDVVLKRVSRAQSDITTLEADFRQEKTIGLLADPVTSRGTFSFRKPNNALWVYSAPEPMTMLVAGGTMTTYYPQMKKAERVAVGKFESRIFRFMGAVTSVEELSKSFTFRFVDRAGEPYRLELKPTIPGASRRVKGITLWIDRERYLISGFEYREADGDVTRYEFSNIRVNPAIPASRFTLSLPPGTRVEQLKVE
jgi:outer membrane lipoprotein-sorting protein